MAAFRTRRRDIIRGRGRLYCVREGQIALSTSQNFSLRVE
jgi:hypothetical protein